MTETMTLRLQGRMIAESPIHIVQPGSREVKSGDRKYREIATETVLVDGKPENLLCIPSSTLRGGIRRAAADVAGAAALEQGAKPPYLTDYLYNAVGGVKGSDSEDKGDVQRRAARREANPVVSLFGAATPWDRSRAYIENATADPDLNGGHVVEMSVVGGRRTDDMATTRGIGAILSGDPFSEWESLRGVAKEDSDRRKTIDKLQSQLRGASPDERQKLNEEISGIKAEMSGGNSILMPLHHASMPRGTVMRTNIVLKDVTAVEAGLFFAAIDRMWETGPEIGGKIAHFYGNVAAEWTVTRKRDGGEDVLGDFRAVPGMGLEAGGEAAEMIAAWREYVASGKMSLIAEG